MPNKDQDPISLFRKAVLMLLDANRKMKECNPGGFSIIPKKAFRTDVGDMRAYFDEEFKKQVRAYQYEYIISLSTADQLVFLDTTPTLRSYANTCEKITFAYDYDKEKVVEVVIE